jgi:hypothetical protein
MTHASTIFGLLSQRGGEADLCGVVSLYSVRGAFFLRQLCSEKPLSRSSREYV